MGVKKFIKKVLESLHIDGFEFSGKKKSLKSLLKKLKTKRVQILKELDSETEQEKRALIKEELELVSFHIKKGKQQLEKLEKS